MTHETTTMQQQATKLIHDRKMSAAWQATCSCSWVSHYCLTEQDAEREAVAHVFLQMHFQKLVAFVATVKP